MKQNAPKILEKVKQPSITLDNMRDLIVSPKLFSTFRWFFHSGEELGGGGKEEEKKHDGGLAEQEEASGEQRKNRTLWREQPPKR